MVFLFVGNNGQLINEICRVPSCTTLTQPAFLHEPGAGAICFVEVLEGASAYKNDEHLLPKEFEED